ncbi:MAG: serine hydrolase domain-containing protein, partial [Spirochaetota bacterium]
MKTTRLDTLFDTMIHSGLHHGAQLAVYKNGSLVYQRSGGFADKQHHRPVNPQTPFMIYSVTKTFIAAAVHQLADRGHIDLDAVLADYWPEFGRKGKQNITISQLLLHQSAINHPGKLPDILSWLKPSWSARRVAGLSMLPEQQGISYYHMFSAHIALGEMIRRVDGRSPAAYLTEEFLTPLGMNHSHTGLPRKLFPTAAIPDTADAKQKTAALVFSNPLMRSIFMPAASINTTATDLGRFYAMLANRGQLDNRHYLSEEAFARAAKLRYDGPDGDSDKRIRWSLGWSLGGYSAWPDKYIDIMGAASTQATMGHAGQGGCALAWADPESGLALAFVNNR